MTDVLTCPVCGETHAPAARVATLAVCGHCGASLNIDTSGAVRRATAQDTDVLSQFDFARLTAARAGIARAKR